eukprot:6214321-Pleurochrysis_carterae.AAC.3
MPEGAPSKIGTPRVSLFKIASAGVPTASAFESVPSANGQRARQRRKRNSCTLRHSAHPLRRGKQNSMGATDANTLAQSGGQSEFHAKGGCRTTPGRAAPASVALCRLTNWPDSQNAGRMRGIGGGMTSGTLVHLVQSFYMLAFIFASLVMTAFMCCLVRRSAKADGGQGGNGQRARTTNPVSVHMRK